MEKKSNPIDKIKVLENSVNELKAIISEFINKKSANFKKIDFFSFNKKKTITNTIDDTDLTAQPVIIDKLDIQDLRTRINCLDTKLNLFIESLENKNEQSDQQYDNLKITLEEIKEEIKREHDERVEQISILKNDLNHGVIMYD
jgi:hypothetical protein